MIAIEIERCDGCGACLEVCPSGALYLVDGKAVVDASLCRDCESCVDACPTGAIVLVEREGTVDPVLVPMSQPATEKIQVRTRPAPVPLRAKVLPALGAALVWTGREILPRLVDIVLDGLVYQGAEQQATGRVQDVSSRDSAGCSKGQGGGGQRRRRRRRGS